jgi:hypothetical protein
MLMPTLASCHGISKYLELVDLGDGLRALEHQWRSDIPRLVTLDTEDVCYLLLNGVVVVHKPHTAQLQAANPCAGLKTCS